MRKIVAFYAWQSDTPAKFNRHLIRIALEDAAKRITDDPTIDAQLIVDYDTEGVPGTPPISQTILNKIDACDIFIPDMSFVARTKAGKFVPNPNVMTEYGYALHAKSHAAMMPIMNTAFGPPEELPFDMGHLRFPIQYHVEADADAVDSQRRAVRRALSQQLEEKLRLQIAATQPPAPEPTPFPSAEPRDGPARFRAPGEPIGYRWDLGPFGSGLSDSISLASGPAMWLRLMPAFDPGRPPWTAQELQEACRAGAVVLQPFIWSRLFTLRAADGIGCYNLLTDDARETNSVAFAFENGEVWAIDTWLLGTHPSELFVGEIEQQWTTRLEDYASFLGRLGLHPPYRWIAGVIGVNHWRLQFPPPHGQIMRFPGWLGPECLSEQIVASGTYDGNQSSTSALLPFFTEIYKQCGMPRPDYLPTK